MGNVIHFAKDKLSNLISGMGLGRDKASAAQYDLCTFTPQQLANMYRSTWLARKGVDIPAFDSTRNWRNWKAKKEQIQKLKDEETRLNVKGKVFEARCRARLFGGSMLLIGDGSTRPDLPLDPTTIARGGIKYLTVVSMADMTAREIDYDPTSENYMMPLLYQISQSIGPMITVHPSRVVRFIGARLPDPRLIPGNVYLGFGDSVLQSALDVIKNTDSTYGNIASLVFEAKVDVINVPDMMDSLSDPAYEGRLKDRFALAAAAKGINGTLILDGLETYASKHANFANLDKIALTFLQTVAGAFDIPLTRFAGISPGGMNSTGSHDMDNYFNNIHSQQELEMQPAMKMLDRCIVRSALGSEPKGLYYEWAPLDEIGEKDLAEMGQIQSSSAVAIAATDIVPLEVLSKSFISQAEETNTFPGLGAAMSEFLLANPNYYKDLQANKDATAAATLKSAQTAATAPAKGAAKKATVPTPARTAPAASSFNK